MAQVYKSAISWFFTVAMVTKNAAKLGWKQEIDHFGTNLRRLTEQLT